MNKSTFAVIIMAIVMVAMMAFGGTYAYFTADAVNENVADIKTAKLELINKGWKDDNSRMTYTATDEIVPGHYLYGSGKLRPEASSDIYTWQKIHLYLNNTNAKAYAFVKVDVKAMAPSGATLMVKYAENNFAPVLKLTGRTDTPKISVDSTTTWNEFKGSEYAEQVGITTSSYIFWYLIDDTTVERQRFEEVDFEFALQFDPAVMSDRKQTGGTYAGDETTGYIPVPGLDNIVEKTNVYAEKNDNSGDIDETTCVNIMDVSVEFKMDFRLIQALGFETPADAYMACFYGDDYTDDDLKNAEHEKEEE